MATQLVLDTGKHFKYFQDGFAPVTEIMPSLATYKTSLLRKPISSVAFSDWGNAQQQNNETSTKYLLFAMRITPYGKSKICRTNCGLASRHTFCRHPGLGRAGAPAWCICSEIRV